MSHRRSRTQAKTVAPFTGAWIEIGRWYEIPKRARSLPSRGRGLKYSFKPLYFILCRSLPSRGRGLKFTYSRDRTPLGAVAPFTGAWIEIQSRKISLLAKIVAPFTGAWIEISIFLLLSLPNSCRSLHGGVD